MFTYFVKGGIMMWPLLMCSIVSVTIIIERLIYYHSIVINPTIIQKVLELLQQRDLDKARKLADSLPSPIKLVFIEGIKNYSSITLESQVQYVAELQIPKLERFLPLLATISSVSTLLGFTGTVIGMIKAFEAITAAGYASPQVVSRGIAEAMITTAAGLLIAIPTVLFYNYFNYRVNRYIHNIEHYTQELLNTKKLK